MLSIILNLSTVFSQDLSQVPTNIFFAKLFINYSLPLLILRWLFRILEDSNRKVNLLYKKFKILYHKTEHNTLYVFKVTLIHALSISQKNCVGLCTWLL